MTTRGFFNDFLEDKPDILSSALRPQTPSPGFGNNFLDYWRRRQGDLYQDYLGGLGQTALAGNEPTQTFQSFLRDFPFQQRFQGLSPSQRGSQAAPPLRFNL